MVGNSASSFKAVGLLLDVAKVDDRKGRVESGDLSRLEFPVVEDAAEVKVRRVGGRKSAKGGKERSKGEVVDIHFVGVVSCCCKKIYRSICCV